LSTYASILSGPSLLALGLSLLLSVEAVGRSNTLTWDKASERISAEIKTSSLDELLGLVSEATGWEIYYQPDTQRSVDLKLRDRPTSEALKLLLGDLSFALITSEGKQRLMVFRTAIGEATELVSAKKDPRDDTTKPIATELVVTVKPGVDIDALARKYGGKVIGRLEEFRTYRLEFETAEAAEKALKELQGDTSVEKVQRNYFVERPPELQGVDLSSLPEMRLQATSPDKTDCSQLIIGLIDTAVHKTGGGADRLLLPQIDVAGESSAPASASPSHGRAMAEAIARAADFSSKGQAKIGILPVNVYGASEQASTFNVALGVQKAIASGAKIINLSLGSGAPSPLLADVIRQGKAQGILFVGAAGNTPTTRSTYPAADPEVLAVTASDRSGQLASYANRGEFVDVIAPGSTVFQFNGQSYLSSGTSVATAHVSGLAAAMADPCKGGLGSVEQKIRQDMSLKK